VTGEHVVTPDDARIVPVRVVADAELVSP